MPNQLRTSAFMVTLAGAAISLALVLHAGRRNPSIVLVLLFVLWVLSPFVGLITRILVSVRRGALVHKTLYWMAIAITVFSLTMYSGLLIPLANKMTAVFLLVPLISWVAGVIMLIIVRLRVKSKR